MLGLHDYAGNPCKYGKWAKVIIVRSVTGYDDSHSTTAEIEAQRLTIIFRPYYGVNKWSVWGVADSYDSPEPISHPDPRLSADPPTLLDSYFNRSEGPHRKSVIEYLGAPMAGDEFRATLGPGVRRAGTSSPN